MKAEQAAHSPRPAPFPARLARAARFDDPRSCPQCGGNCRVRDSRPSPHGWRRRRKCDSCGWAFTSFEISAEELDRLIGEAGKIGLTEAYRQLLDMASKLKAQASGADRP